MTEQHPITPPSELLQRLRKEAPVYRVGGTSYCDVGREKWLIERAAQWGYDQRGEVNESKLQQARDQELEACCEEMKSIPSPLGIPFGEMASNALRAARRQKPPSLKEQALEEVGVFEGMGTCNIDIIRRALEALPDD